MRDFVIQVLSLGISGALIGLVLGIGAYLVQRFLSHRRPTRSMVSILTWSVGLSVVAAVILTFPLLIATFALSGGGPYGTSLPHPLTPFVLPASVGALLGFVSAWRQREHLLLPARLVGYTLTGALAFAAHFALWPLLDQFFNDRGSGG